MNEEITELPFTVLDLRSDHDRAEPARLAQETRSYSFPDPKTHHVLKLTIVDHLGKHDGGTVLVHKSRTCLNCDSYSPDSGPDWDAKVDGPCLNMCTAARRADDGAFCPDHQTKSEFAAGLHRAHVPVFTVVEGIAA